MGAAAAGRAEPEQAGRTDGTQAAHSPTRTTAIDQNPIRRRGTGLRAFEAARASAGLTLFASAGDRVIYLIDLHGKVVHTWSMPYPPGSYGYLTEKGTLFFNGQIPNETFLGRGLSRVALHWRRTGRARSSGRCANGIIITTVGFSGTATFSCSAPGNYPTRLPRKVQGGRPGTEVNGRMWADYLVELTRDGRTVWEWRAWEHLDPAIDRITAVQDNRSEWTHGNAIMELSDGDLLVSFRNISTIIRIRRQTGDIAWKLGAPPLAGQHAPTPLANGNILIFDNGPHRVDHSFPFSRVIEVDPATNEIVWKYQEANLHNFYSPRISNAQRLPNGNTLINEGFFGRFFEVTVEGEVVWEYVNPHFGPMSAAANVQSNQVFRVYRYTEEEIERARASAQ